MSISPPTKEEIALIQLKDRIPDITDRQVHENFKDELYLLRWLHARHMNAEKTEHLIRNSIKWRLENNIGTVATNDLTEDYAWNYPFYSDAVDNNGLPVFSLSPGSWDIRHIVEKGEKDKFVQYMSRMYVKIEQTMIRLNRERHAKQKQEKEHKDGGGGGTPTSTSSSKLKTTGVIIIVDLKGYSRHQLTSLKTVETSLEIANNYEHYFPQMAERVYLINVSRVFAVLLKMLKPLLNLPCVEVFDSNEDKWKAAILSHISPDQLRPQFGGTKTDACSIKITPCEDIIQNSDA